MQNHEPIDGLNTPALVTAGFVAAIGTFVLIVGLQVLYLNYDAAQTKAALSRPENTSSASLLAEQRSKINRYGWLDRQNDIVAVPIDLAIQITARELSADRSIDDAGQINVETQQEPF